MDYYTLHKQFVYIKDEVLYSQVLKAYQNRKSFSLALRKGKERFWLNFVLDPEVASFFIDHEPLSKENFHFAVLFNNLLKNARIVEFNQLLGERIFVFKFEKKDFSGTSRFIKLIFEIIGKKVNLVLVEDERIIDAFKREEASLGERVLLPGRVFFFPSSPSGQYIWDTERERIVEAVVKEGISVLPKFFYPVPKFIVEELKVRLNKESFDSPQDVVSFWSLFLKIKEELFSPYLYFYERSFKIFPLERKNLGKAKAIEPNEAIKAYIKAFEQQSIFNSLKGELSKVLKRERKKLERVLSDVRSQLKRCKDREKYRLWAEAILINLNKIESDTELLEVPNPYNEKEMLRIPLEKGWKATKIAEGYFEKYAKLKKAEEFLREREKGLEIELSFIRDLEWQLENAESSEDLEDMKGILEEAGYIKLPSRKKKKSLLSSVKMFRLKDLEIYVGKNSRGNDFVTFKLASRDDLWFHVKGYPGAHVIAKTSRELTLDELEKVASIAAFFSKAKSSSSVEVDYTKVKFVKRAKNYKPGMVIYKNFSTFRVKPQIPEEVEHVEKD